MQVIPCSGIINIAIHGETVKVRRDTIRKLYRQGILEFFGSGDKDIDDYLIRAVSRDIHFGNRAPGQWEPDSVLEIYCENGIPNGTDIHSFPGCNTHYNSESWCRIDDYVNLALEGMGKHDRVFHQPYNGAVINIHWS